jgi:hypothetical protein
MTNLKCLAIVVRNQNYIHEEINSTVNPENVCCTSKYNRFSFDFPSETLRRNYVEE